eukprot:1175628-Prorocentrum_minimum.AAC.2
MAHHKFVFKLLSSMHHAQPMGSSCLNRILKEVWSSGIFKDVKGNRIRRVQALVAGGTKVKFNISYYYAAV